MVYRKFTESQIGFARAFSRELIVAKDIDDPKEAMKIAFDFVNLFEDISDKYREQEERDV